ncbi:HAD family hydrolase [Rhizobium sp. BT04]|uniref:HAD family hydrolase n=1 Tax=Rhizobium sp. BT04 TaxID=3045157 RepID=UPI0024B3DF4A|nr:HAD family hydrolase [Rhizobium sp. BT04]
MTGVALVVGGGGLQGLPVLRAVRAMGWKAVVADTITDNINRFEADRYFVAPPVAHLSEFSEFLRDLIASEKIDAIFPTTMFDLPALAKLRPELEILGARVFASTTELVSVLEDKLLATEAATAAHLPTLPTIDPETHDFSFPLIGKPRRGWGGRDMVHAKDRAEYLEASANGAAEGYLWQRKIGSFQEWSVDFAIGEGGAVSEITKRLRVRASGGYAVISEVIEKGGPDQLAKATAQWLARNGALGLFNVQFLEENGNYWLTDINPRPGTSSVSALAAGSNLVTFLLEGRSAPSTGGYLIRTLRDTFIASGISGAKGVVFDLDETVIDQKSWMAAKLEIVIDDLSSELNDLSQFREIALQIIDEGPWDRLIDVALQRAGLPRSMSERMITAWRSAMPTGVAIHLDAQGLAEDLVRRGVPISILTDNPAASQKQKIGLLPSPWGQTHVILTDELASPKPATAGFELAASRLGMAPGDLVCIGDSPWRDAVGALRAGYRGAVIVQRAGSMHNPSKGLFNQRFPEFSSRVSWVPSLSGLGHLLVRENR